ncbi:13253_t:CDS:2 [Funneliformis caledonium]|uniref:13253_t:CDS:1 n=1 Tax=Funneliformis caledonium TaxID=1117310 RepID=A0A9N9BWX7_9GLOM|nr:13253_t:CDS:2 [Funneliformis caledonium]
MVLYNHAWHVYTIRHVLVTPLYSSDATQSKSQSAMSESSILTFFVDSGDLQFFSRMQIP